MKPDRPPVAIVHYSAPPIVGGVEAVMAEHARLLVEAGYPTTIVAGRGGESGLPPECAVHLIPEMDTEHPDNLALAAALEDGRLLPLFADLKARIERGLARALGPADLVIAHNVVTTHFNLPLTAALHDRAARSPASPVAAWCHDISRYVNPASGARQRTGHPWDLLRICQPSLTYVAVSEQRRQTLAGVLGCPGDRIHVIPNGVNPGTLLGLSEVGQALVEAYELPGCDLILLMPVRITRAKHIEFAMHVVAALKAAGQRVCLIVTGPPDPHAPDIEGYVGQLRALREALQVERQVRFVYDGTAGLPGPLHIGDKIVAELYRAADLVLMPSHREGFGLPVLEAGLVDRPVFATRIPVLDAVGEARVHVIERDESPDRVAGRMVEWAGQDRSHGLRRRVRQSYTWPAIFTGQIQPLLGALASRAGGRGS